MSMAARSTTTTARPGCSEPDHAPPQGGEWRAQAKAPSANGTVVYLNVNPDLQAVGRALAAGAQLLTPRVGLPDGMGSLVHVQDVECKRIGLPAQR